MFEMADTDGLFRVRRYDLYRNGERISIDIQEKIAGSSQYQFYAVPQINNRLTDEEQYWGVGVTEQSALEDCLLRIRHVHHLETLFPFLPKREYT